ncbi:MAG TPA: hypothetical protein VKE69_07265, partial [Planctomycetota bacterium]|nr:hypothetical protein [Planctomycetota bacterium]
AIACTAPTLALPYLSDDWAHLEAARNEPTPLHSLDPTTPVVAQFIRPVARFVWWFLERVAPHDAWPARALCVALFAIVALLVVPALRRMGVPRGIATASAACFAASPTAVEIVAWVSNLYSLLSLGFALAAVATLPRRPAWRGFLVPSAFVLLSLLSKEDVFLLPILLVLAGARFRARRVPRWILPAAPAFAALAAIVALRLAIFGGLGGYTEGADKRSVFLTRWLDGFEREMRDECPVGLFTPVRWAGWRRSASRDRIETALALLPASVVALGLGTRACAIGAVRGLTIAPLGILPVLATFYLGPELNNTRLLFFPGVGLALLAAASLAGAPFGRRGRWAGVGAFALVSLAVGRSNFGAWRDAGAAMERVVPLVSSVVRGMPPNSTVLTYGLVGQYHGAQCFIGAIPFAFQRALDRRDFVMGDRHLGAFDAVMEFDPALRAYFDPLERPPRALEPGVATTLRFVHLPDARDDDDDRAACRLLDGGASNGARGEWMLSAYNPLCALLLPALAVPDGAEIEVRADGGETPEGALRLVALFRDGAKVMHQEIGASGKLALPAGARAVRLEVYPRPEAVSSLASIVVTARPREAK